MTNIKLCRWVGNSATPHSSGDGNGKKVTCTATLTPMHGCLLFSSYNQWGAMAQNSRRSCESALMGAPSVQSCGGAKALLRSGGRWGPKESDPDNPPLGRVLFSALRAQFVIH
jgi:hypothetical protein